MKKSSTVFLQTIVVLLGIGAFALLLWEPTIEGRNVNSTLYEVYFNDPFLVLVYLGSIPFFVGLYKAFKILGYVGNNKAFSQEVVNAFRTIKYCAITIIGFVVVEEIIILMNHGNDDAAGGVFMGILITVGSIIVAAAANTFERTLQKAVDIKSENDLTV